MILNKETWDWIAKLAGAKRVKNCYVRDGDGKPTWHYEKGWTRWKNGVPKHYTRSVSELTVGKDWLSRMFPVQYVSLRLANGRELALTLAEIKAAESAEAEREDLKRLAQESAWRTIDLANKLASERWTSLDPDEDRRLYAD